MIAEQPRATGSRRDRATIGAARVVACILAFLGLVGMLRVGSASGDAGTADLATLQVHPLTALAWLALGLLGIAMSVAASRARRYLIGAGTLLVVWAIAGIATGGSVTTFLTDDPRNVGLMLALGIGALAIALGPTPDFLEEALALPDAEAPEDIEGVRPPSAVVRRPPPSEAP